MKICRYECSACFGEFWTLPPFHPAFCSHCGRKLLITTSEVELCKRLAVENEAADAEA